MVTPETHCFADDGRFPNSAYPLLVYRGAVLADAAHIERGFAGHGWFNGWRDGIFDYHHFHSIAHEVLGIVAGEARVLFGGPKGKTLTLRAGDVVVIPAGVAHCNIGGSRDFLVVGAYAEGADYDICRGEPGDHDAAVARIGRVAVPPADPVMGAEAGLRRLWMVP